MKPLPALKQGIVSADRRVRVRPRGLQQTDSFKRQPRETGSWPNHRTQRLNARTPELAQPPPLP